LRLVQGGESDRIAGGRQQAQADSYLAQRARCRERSIRSRRRRGA
jgi:hypothetical protein